MKYTPKSIKRTLKKCITKISASPETYAKNPGRDFTRTRKLPFETVLKSVLSMTGKSLRGELMDLFGLKLDTPTVSAFLQQICTASISVTASFAALHRHDRSCCSCRPKCDRLHPRFQESHHAPEHNCHPASPETPGQSCQHR